MRVISVKLEDGLERRLVAAARKRRTSKSNLVRTAIHVYLEEIQETKAGSCLEVAGDLFGSAEGPEDLSTNARHMEGFGE